MKHIDCFFALVRAGLWERDVELQECGDADFKEICRLGEEKAVLGLVAAGLYQVKGQKPPKEVVLPVIGTMVQLEQRNSAMNRFIGELVSRMRKEGVYTLLVKGQGVAQCYERPLWRSSGDIDFFLSDENYAKADAYLMPLASSVEKDTGGHHGMTIDGWVVELHNSLHCGLSKRIEKVLDKMKRESFYEGKVRSWMNGKVSVFLLSRENEILYGFCHFLNHFYRGGIGLRQICDWCRLLWTYRESLNHGLLESRVKEMGLMSEWKAFGAFAVEYLGMPIEAMPLYDSSARWHRKADKICKFVMAVGNFGHNRDLSYYGKKSYLMQKIISFGQRTGDLIHHANIFPLDSMRFFPKIVINGLISAVRGE